MFLNYSFGVACWQYKTIPYVGARSLRELAKRPLIYVKVPGTEFYGDRLDALWDILAPTGGSHGSDWPNSDSAGTYPQVLKMGEEYFHGKGTAAAEEYFRKNSMAAYRCIKRDARQPGL
jgi:predicted TIM-barrel fold metal-dependent hydrolase